MTFFITDTLGDCNIYEVDLEGKEYTVGKFVEEILAEYPDEWGNIEIKDIDVVIYRDGKLISRFNNEILNKKIQQVVAQGGWSRMDYIIYLL